MKKKLLASALLACSLVTLGAVSAARAEPLPIGTTTVLETVDGVAATTGGNLSVEGIVQGESTARVFEINFSSSSATSQSIEDRCIKFLLMAQSHPGRYQIEMVTFNGSSSLTSCKLKSR